LKVSKFLKTAYCVVFSREDAEFVLKNGDLNFIQPIEIAKEFINHQKAIR
jgi:hypothetical protein